jgi:hypothetical protein
MVLKLRDICGLSIVVCIFKKTVMRYAVIFLVKSRYKDLKILFTNLSDNVLLEGSTLMNKKVHRPLKTSKKKFEHQLFVMGPL